MENSERRRDMLVLAAGAAVGIALAIAGLLADAGPGPLPDHAAARVNGVVIDKEDLADTLAALGSDSRDLLDSADRAWILERLIEEELLVQRALDLGLPRSDRGARTALVDAMIRMVTQDAAASMPGERELREWYRDNFESFAASPRLRVETRMLGSEQAARDLLQSLRSGTGPVDDLAAGAVAGLPDELLPPAKIRDYLGPGIMQDLQDAPTLEWTGPFPMGERWVVARVAERKAQTLPPFEELRDEAERAWRRARMDSALREYLDRLRRDAEIRVADP